MTALRREVFERDEYRCQHIFKAGEFEMTCKEPVTWESGHLAHVISRARGGDDSLENCVTKCEHCHMVKEHRGNKPVPKKPSAEDAAKESA